MIFGWEGLGVVGWILVIVILLICCSSLFLCCIETDEELITSSCNRTYQAPYDPRSDGTVDLGLMLYSSHYYNTHNDHHNYCDLSSGWADCGDVVGGGGEAGDGGGCDGGGGGDGGADCG